MVARWPRIPCHPANTSLQVEVDYLKATVCKAGSTLSKALRMTMGQGQLTCFFCGMMNHFSLPFMVLVWPFLLFWLTCIVLCETGAGKHMCCRRARDGNGQHRHREDNISAAGCSMHLNEMVQLLIRAAKFTFCPCDTGSTLRSEEDHCQHLYSRHWQQ